MILVIIYLNFNKLFILYINASGGSVETVLHQNSNDEREQIITYANKIFNEHEKKYFIIKQECLVIIQEVKKFKQYLNVKPFKIITDYMILKTIYIVNLLSERKAQQLYKF